MTDEQINIKVAELCEHPFEVREVCRICKGKTPYMAGDDYGITLWEECRHCNNTGKTAPYYVGLLNYAADLNACHVFEKTLTIEQHDFFKVLLSRITADHFHETGEHWSPHPHSATARQRCEAFLRVHNQWEE